MSSADVADHCTVCHKCETPCPVDIDFGDVSMAMRDLLRRMGKKRFNPGTAASMLFLNATNPETIKVTRKVMIDWGFKRAASRPIAPLSAGCAGADEAPAGHAPASRHCSEQVIHFVNKKMPGGLPKKTARALLDIEDRNYVPIIRDPDSHDQRVGGGVLFPGLRLGAAVLAGRPGHPGDALARRRADRAAAGLFVLRLSAARLRAISTRREKIITDNRVLFHRVANTLNYLDIKTVVVSCGTCYDQLQDYKFGEIFPGCRIIDIHEFLMEKGVRLEGVTGTRYMYHDPCHTPMKTYDPLKVVNTLMDEAQERSRRTIAAAASPVRSRSSRPTSRPRCGSAKSEEMRKRRGQAAGRRLRWRGEDSHLLPVLLAGLEALQRRCGRMPTTSWWRSRRHVLGEDWLADYVQTANSGGIERVLV